MTKPVGSDITLLQINTLHCNRKEMEHKEDKSKSHDTGIVHSAVGISWDEAILTSEEIKP